MFFSKYIVSVLDMKSNISPTIVFCYFVFVLDSRVVYQIKRGFANAFTNLLIMRTYA